MEELIDLLEQCNDVFGLTLMFLSLEYLLLFPSLIYFCLGTLSENRMACLDYIQFTTNATNLPLTVVYISGNFF